MWSHTLLKNSIQYTTLNLNVDSLLLVALSTTGICSKKKKKKKGICSITVSFWKVQLCLLTD